MDERTKRCAECGWEGRRLPLEEDCPACLKPGCTIVLCDVPGCGMDATCGETTGDGFRMLCYEHSAAAYDAAPCERCRL